VAAGSRQYFLYTPEMHLLAESELTAASRPAIANEFVWFNDHPLAQIDAIGIVAWTFTDHLGTPVLQTSAQQGVVWRAEYEPYVSVYTLRSYDRHQPLRLPGQEAEQLGLGANGVTERSYNIYRWYKSGIGRYTQPDPFDAVAAAHSGRIMLIPDNRYGYAAQSPAMAVDPVGLFPKDPSCVAQWTALGLLGGSVLGGAVGATTGGTVCTFVAPGVGTVVCGAGGGVAGAVQGGVIGTVAGALFGLLVCPDAKCEEDTHCEELRKVDESTCRYFASRKDWRRYRACMSQAAVRYSECLRFGAPLSPLFPSPFED
jgi:RHS repeat-associated protein